MKINAINGIFSRNTCVGNNNFKTKPMPFDSVSFSADRTAPLLNKVNEVKDIEDNLKILGTDLKTCSTEQLFNAIGIKTQITDDGLLIVDKFSQPTENITFEKIGIDENKLFKDIKEIRKDADFTNSKVTDLGNLEEIGWSANFKDSEVTNLGNLKRISGFANFENSKVKSLGHLKGIWGSATFKNAELKDLGELETIGGSVDFTNSKLTNLGNLKIIDGSADFTNSEIENLGKLEKIVWNANFKNAKIEDLANLHTIGGDANFENSKVSELGMLKEIGGNANFRNSDISTLKNLKIIRGSADFENSKVTNLGELQTIGGNANFRNSAITSLGKLSKVGGFVYLEGSNISKREYMDYLQRGNNAEILKACGIESRKGDDNLLIINRYNQPSDKFTFEDIYINEKVLFENIGVIEKDADFENSTLTDLGDLKFIGCFANFRNSKITDLKKLDKIGKGADFRNSEVPNLGQISKIGGLVYLKDSKITKEEFFKYFNRALNADNQKKSEDGFVEALNACGIDTEVAKDGSLLISSYHQPSDLYTFDDLGINEKELFKKVKKIRGDADFSNSSVTDLGNLEMILGNADFRNSNVVNLGNLKNIRGNAYYGNSKIENPEVLKSITKGEVKED